MMTVRETPLAFISSSRVSGAASRSGTLAPSANGKSGSCFQTWTWGSRIRIWAPNPRLPAAAPASSARRVISDINRLQLFDDVLRAALVAGARPLAGYVEIDAEPSLEADGFQH